MGRKDRYESHVRPKLNDIKKWITTMNEGQIAKKLGINQSTFTRYKAEHEELRAALIAGIEELRDELKDALKKKAKGFKYEETKTVVKDENGKKTKYIEKYEKYAPPDTGAIHLLLKNIDPDWRNDDKATMDLKKQELELKKQKQEENNW